MRILIIGAGVTGSLFASYLINGKDKLERKLRDKVEINLLARGETYKRIRDHGLKINHVQQKIVTIDRIPVIDKLESGDTYNYVLIFLRKTQRNELLPLLKSNRSDCFVFFGNNGTGLEELKSFLPPVKTVLGFAGVGGRRENDTVFSVHGRKPAITFGTREPDRKKRMRQLKRIFRICDTAPTLIGDMDSWLKYHLSLVIPLARALYKDGGDNVSLAENTDLLKQTVQSIKENYNALRTLKYPVKPAKLRIMMTVPDLLIRRKLSRLLASELGRLVVYDHCMAAPEEMKELSLELQDLTGLEE